MKKIKPAVIGANGPVNVKKNTVTSLNGRDEVRLIVKPKTWVIKYLGLSGQVHCHDITGYSKADAVSKVIGIKEIYWIKNAE